jgi:hypothetical protein
MKIVINFSLYNIFFLLIMSHKIYSQEILIESFEAKKNNKIYLKYDQIKQIYILEINSKNTKTIRTNSNIFYELFMDNYGNSIAGIYYGDNKKTDILINNKILKNDCLNKNFYIHKKTFIWFSECGNKNYISFVNKNISLRRLEIKFPPIKFIRKENDLFFLVNSFRTHILYKVDIKNDDLIVNKFKLPFYQNLNHIEIEKLYYKYFNENYSLLNNDYGRLSWFLSYQLLAVSELLKIRDFDYLYGDIVKKSNTILKNLIQQYEKGKWKAIKYNDQNKAERSLVLDSTIIYSMISLCNNLKKDCKFKNKINKILEEIYLYYENSYNEKYNHYIFNKDSNSKDFLPYNMQNVFALALIENLKFNDNKKYLKKTEQLFDSFYINFYNNKSYWDYWPIYSKHHSKFKGRGEDIRHASWNVFFVMEFCQKASISYQNKCKFIKKKINEIFIKLTVNNGFKQYLFSDKIISLKYPEWFWIKFVKKNHSFFNRLLHDNFFKFDGGYFLSNVFLYKKLNNLSNL